MGAYIHAGCTPAAASTETRPVALAAWYVERRGGTCTRRSTVITACGAGAGGLGVRAGRRNAEQVTPGRRAALAAGAGVAVEVSTYLDERRGCRRTPQVPLGRSHTPTWATATTKAQCGAQSAAVTRGTEKERNADGAGKRGNVQEQSSRLGMPLGAGGIASPQVSSRWCLDHNTSRPRVSCFWERTPGDGIAPAANYFEAEVVLAAECAATGSMQADPRRCQGRQAGRRARGQAFKRSTVQGMWGSRSAQTAKRNYNLQGGSQKL